MGAAARRSARKMPSPLRQRTRASPHWSMASARSARNPGRQRQDVAAAGAAGSPPRDRRLTLSRAPARIAADVRVVAALPTLGRAL